MTTTVVHLKIKGGIKVQDCDVYIGRGMKRGGWDLKQSPLHNPFSVNAYGRDSAIRKYRRHLLRSPQLLALLPALRGKRLGCWCAPEACHGDVIVELLSKMTDSELLGEDSESEASE